MRPTFPTKATGAPSPFPPRTRGISRKRGVHPRAGISELITGAQSVLKASAGFGEEGRVLGQKGDAAARHQPCPSPQAEWRVT
jgi:hypothetical protein